MSHSAIYERIGEASGPDVAVILGLSSTREAIPLAQRLQSHGRRVCVIPVLNSDTFDPRSLQHVTNDQIIRHVAHELDKFAAREGATNSIQLVAQSLGAAHSMPILTGRIKTAAQIEKVIFTAAYLSPKDRKYIWFLKNRGSALTRFLFWALSFRSQKLKQKSAAGPLGYEEHPRIKEYHDRFEWLPRAFSVQCYKAVSAALDLLSELKVPAVFIEGAHDYRLHPLAEEFFNLILGPKARVPALNSGHYVLLDNDMDLVVEALDARAVGEPAHV